MADGTSIEWVRTLNADGSVSDGATWNVITGCTVISAGCKNCYAMKLAGGRLKHHPSRIGLTQSSAAGPVWTGEVRFNEHWLDQPRNWSRGRKIFVCAHGDLFHEGVPFEVLDKIFAVMFMAPQHTYQVLTKRADRMRAYVTELVGGQRQICEAALTIQGGIAGPLLVKEALGKGVDGKAPYAMPRNVWLGVSIEDQAAADLRIPLLLDTPAAVRWLSCEPLLSRIALRRYLKGNGIHWGVVGGESGHRARPMHPAWPLELCDQFAEYGIPFHFKQWGEWAVVTPESRADLPSNLMRVVNAGVAGDAQEAWPDALMWRAGKKKAGRLLNGRLFDGCPA